MSNVCISYFFSMPYRKRFQHRKKQAREKREKKFQQRLESSDTCIPLSETDTILTSESSFTTTDESQSLSGVTDHIGTCVRDSPGDTSDTPLHLLHGSLCLPSKAWCDQSPEGLNKLIFCKLSQFSSSNSQPLIVTHSLTVNSDLTWKLFILNHEITTSCSILETFPSRLSEETFSKLLAKLDSASICMGQPDADFVCMVTAKKGMVVSRDGKIACTVDNNTYLKTVRTSDCEILCAAEKCCACKNYRATLRSMYHRWNKKSRCSSDFTNERYMNTPEKRRKMEKLKKRVHTAEQKVVKLKEKVHKLIDCNGEALDENLHSDMIAIMKENT